MKTAEEKFIQSVGRDMMAIAIAAFIAGVLAVVVAQSVFS